MKVMFFAIPDCQIFTSEFIKPLVNSYSYYGSYRYNVLDSFRYNQKRIALCNVLDSFHYKCFGTNTSTHRHNFQSNYTHNRIDNLLLLQMLLLQYLVLLPMLLHQLLAMHF